MLTDQDNAIVSYPGGKQDVCRELVRLFPRGGHWLEPFAGGASTTLAAVRESRFDSYWLNDHNRGVYSFLTVLPSDPHRLAAMADQLREKPTKKLHKWSREVLRSVHTTPFDNAVAFYVGQNVSYNGKGPLIAGASVSRPAQRYTDRKVSLLPEWAKLLQGVRITQLDYSDCLREVGRDWRVFLDPPYDEPIKQYLHHEVFDHDRLAAVAKSLRCPVAITYDRNEQHFIRYPGWRFYERRGERKPEFVILNFQPEQVPDDWRLVRRLELVA